LPGDFVAFVGPSGSGKSTLYRLLLGFERPDSGAILLDGHDLSSLDLPAVRSRLGVVMQNGRIVAASIFKNIASTTTLTMEDAWEAARAAGLAEDIEAMPMGMHTILPEGGGLSGGQKQRLLIARALARKPRIVLFDEATSALDNRTQAVVQASLKILSTTRLVIAHRLSTIEEADRIYVMDRGRIVEVGRYNELIDRNGVFAAIAGRQAF
jgi:ABC-type bacteriocin/lantibiotic exporter with double-glycine peptidase domain